MACVFHKIGWLNQNGTINDSIRTRYDEIPGVSSNIIKCLSYKNTSPEKKKKKKRNEKISDLKIGLEVLPSVEVVEKLKCISFMINYGLDNCLEEILKSKNKTIG